MNRLTLIFGAILVIVLLCLAASTMAQDPNDPGEPDVVYLTPGGMRSPSGDTLYVWPDSFPQDVIMYVNFWNDNPIRAIITPFIDTCNGPPCDAYLDLSKNNGFVELPKCFEGSRVEHWDMFVVKVGYYPPILPMGAGSMYADPVPPGDGLLATLVFTVFDTGRICLDSCFYPPSSQLTFVDSQSHGYVPVFKKRTFVISDCPYTSGDPNFDGKMDIVDVVYLINYIFRSGASPCFVKSGDINCDDEVDIIDAVYLVDYLFRHGPPPAYCP